MTTTLSSTAVEKSSRGTAACALRQRTGEGIFTAVKPWAYCHLLEGVVDKPGSRGATAHTHPCETVSPCGAVEYAHDSHAVGFSQSWTVKMEEKPRGDAARTSLSDAAGGAPWGLAVGTLPYWDLKKRSAAVRISCEGGWG